MDLIGALRSFLRVAETGSFSAVAGERGVTQPAVSRQVSALEEHLSARLVQRSTQAVTLTDEGRALLPAARRLVEEADSLQTVVGGRRGKAVGRVRIAMPVALGLHVAARLDGLLADHDELSIELLLRDGGSNVVEEGLDLEVQLGPLADTSLIARPIGLTTTYVVASPDYVRSRPPVEHPNDLLACDCVIHQRWSDDVRWWFVDQAAGGSEGIAFPIAVKGRVWTNNGACAREAALNGRGVALLSHLLVTEDLEAGRLLRLLPHHPTRRSPIYLLYPSKRIMPERTRATIDFLERIFGEDPEMRSR